MEMRERNKRAELKEVPANTESVQVSTSSDELNALRKRVAVLEGECRPA